MGRRNRRLVREAPAVRREEREAAEVLLAGQLPSIVSPSPQRTVTNWRTDPSPALIPSSHGCSAITT